MAVSGACLAARAGVPVALVGPPALLGVAHGLVVLPASAERPDAAAPVQAIRSTPELSISVAMRALAAGQGCAVVSCGSTGAALAAAVLLLGRAEGIERPGILTLLPRADGGELGLVDAGASVDTRPQHLLGFAQQGSAALRQRGLAAPRVGLLANGTEPGKGDARVQAAAALLEADPTLRYVGLVEPPEALRGACDVLVCDGFVGNVLLTTAEATAELVGGMVREELTRGPLERLGAWLAGRGLARLRARLGYGAAGGGLLLGVRGVVVIGHGRSDAEAVAAALERAWRQGRSAAQ